jgi:hypothetical protein
MTRSKLITKSNQCVQIDNVVFLHLSFWHLFTQKTNKKTMNCNNVLGIEKFIEKMVLKLSF